MVRNLTFPLVAHQYMGRFSSVGPSGTGAGREKAVEWIHSGIERDWW